jgi:ADP-ribose pyrophosphatase
MSTPSEPQALLSPGATGQVDDAALIERGLSRRSMCSGKLLQAVVDAVELPDGSLASREFVIHPGAVMIVPLLDDGRVVLERQYRYPMGRVMLEFPAGKLDPGESSLLCAQRELQEETGYTAQEWAYAGVLHPVISYSTEHIDIWFARGLTLGARHLDAGEFLDVFIAWPHELAAWARQGQLTDAKTLVAMWWLQNVQSGEAPLAWRAADDPAQPQPPGPRVPEVSATSP